MRITVAVVLSLAVAAGCSKKKGEGGGGGDDCGPASITIDGKPFDIKQMVAAYDKKYDTTTIYGFNYDQDQCEGAIKGMFQHPDDGMSFRVASTNAVGIDAHAQMGGDVSVEMTKKPEKPGDQVEMCVKKVTFEPMVGRLKGKSVTMSGKFTGKYCGETKR